MRRFGNIALLLLAAGCFDANVGDGAPLTCVDDAACPAPLRCARALGLCVDEAAAIAPLLESVTLLPAGVVPSQTAVTVQAVVRGAATAVSLTAVGVSAVVLNAVAERPGSYVGSFAAPATDAALVFDAALTDLYGVVHSQLDVARLDVDGSAPTVTDVRARVLAGASLEVAVAFSEPVSGEVTVVGPDGSAGAALAATATVDVVAVVAEIGSGPWALLVDVVDAVGAPNTATLPLPAVRSVVFSPTTVRPGGAVTVTLTADDADSVAAVVAGAVVPLTARGAGVFTTELAAPAETARVDLVLDGAAVLEAFAAGEITVDNVPPTVIAVEGSAADGVASPAHPLRLDVTFSEPVSGTLTLVDTAGAGRVVAAPSSTTRVVIEVDAAGFSDGALALDIAVTDRVDNLLAAREPLAVIVDATPPAPPADADVRAHRRLFPSPLVTVDVPVDTSVVRYEVREPISGLLLGAGPGPTIALVPGDWRGITVAAVDAGENIGPQSAVRHSTLTVAVDTADPRVAAVAMQGDASGRVGLFDEPITASTTSPTAVSRRRILSRAPATSLTVQTIAFHEDRGRVWTVAADGVEEFDGARLVDVSPVLLQPRFVTYHPLRRQVIVIGGPSGRAVFTVDERGATQVIDDIDDVDHPPPPSLRHARCSGTARMSSSRAASIPSLSTSKLARSPRRSTAAAPARLAPSWWMAPTSTTSHPSSSGGMWHRDSSTSLRSMRATTTSHAQSQARRSSI